MSEDGGRQWDAVVDVICVGSSPGVLAYAVVCAAADLDVLLIDLPSAPDAGFADFMASMTGDLDPPSADWSSPIAAQECRVPDRAVGEGEPVPGRRASLEPFVGEHLRQWSALCLASPSGVMFTQVPDVLGPMRTEDGESIMAAVLGGYRPPLDDWLRAQVADLLPAEDRLRTVVFDEGRIAGAELVDGSRVGATGGLAFPVGPALSVWPSDEIAADVALVGRPAGRFARIELFGQ